MHDSSSIHVLLLSPSMISVTRNNSSLCGSKINSWQKLCSPIFVMVANLSKMPYEIPCKTNCHDTGIALEVPCEVPLKCTLGTHFPVTPQFSENCV